ncbi:MAG: hypothetical protein ACPGRE_01415 [Flavobacteriaceae bacterium]
MKPRQIKHLVLILFSFLYHTNHGQNLENLTFFNKEDFTTREEFNDMVSDLYGNKYFANVGGLVIYDGSEWQTIKLKSNASITSLLRREDGTIIYGSYDQVGMIKRDDYGEFHLEPLNLNLSKRAREKIEHIWQLHELNNSIVAMSSNQLIVIKNGFTTFIKPKNYFNFSFKYNKQIIIQDSGNGLFVLSEDNQLTPFLEDRAVLKSENISGFDIDTKNNLYLITEAGSIIYTNNIQHFHTSNALREHLEKDQVRSAALSNNKLIIGTLNAEVYSIDITSNTLKAKHLFKLQENSSIRKVIKEEHPEGLWFLLDNGVYFANTNLPDTNIFKSGAVYSFEKHQDKLYIATSKGVFYQDADKFKKVEGLKGLTWSLKSTGEDLIISHHRGLYLLRGKRLSKIDDSDSFWKITAINNDTYLASTYNGFHLLTNKNNQWKISSKIKGFNESSRDLFYNKSNGDIWICHGYKGIYKIGLNKNMDQVQNLSHFTNTNGLDNYFNTNISTFNGEQIFTTNQGIFKYDKTNNQFTRHDYLNQILNPELNTRLFRQINDTIWYVQDDQLGYIDTKQPQIKHDKIFYNSRGKLNESMEAIYLPNNNEVYVATNEGIKDYNLNFNKIKPTRKSRFTSITYQDKNQSTHHSKLDTIITLPPLFKNLSINFASPQLGISKKNKYSYYISPISKDFSQWTKQATISIPTLVAGEYTLLAKEIDEFGTESETAKLHIKVEQLWYKTNSFYTIISLILLFLVSSIGLKTRRSFNQKLIKEKKDSEQNERMLKLEIEKLKLKKDNEEITELKNKLEQNIKIQSEELSDYILKLSSKKHVMDHTFERLTKLRKHLKSSKAQKEVISIQQEIKQSSISEEQLLIFEENFEKLHLNFYANLKQEYPEISTRELRLCSFILLNMSNKEISPLLNISIRGVESARYRIGKKLDLKESSLKDHLQSLSEK